MSTLTEKEIAEAGELWAKIEKMEASRNKKELKIRTFESEIGVLKSRIKRVRFIASSYNLKAREYRLKIDLLKSKIKLEYVKVSQLNNKCSALYKEFFAIEQSKTCLGCLNGACSLLKVDRNLTATRCGEYTDLPF